MDVNLPGINGLDATRQILIGAGDAVVVLLLSTYEEEEYAPRAADAAPRRISRRRFSAPTGWKPLGGRLRVAPGAARSPPSPRDGRARSTP